MDGFTSLQVWLPGRDALEDGETLQYDSTAYDCMSSMSLEWPSLSFDILRDTLGAPRTLFPHSLFMVAGTQAAHAKLNYLAIMKVSNLSQGKHGRDHNGGKDDEMVVRDDSEEEDEEEAKLHIRKVAHTGSINRVRSMPQASHVIASWSENAQVQILNIQGLMNEIADELEPNTSVQGKIQKIAATQVHAHSSEGYALDWSPIADGHLVSGDCRANIHIWTPSTAGKWSVSAGMKGHNGSVEDLQWSPTEHTVFASCSVDKTIRIWDTREKSKAMITVEDAHTADINVISWNRSTQYMLASGGDDGALKVWDLRAFSAQQTGVDGPKPVADFVYHRKPVTSVEWCPNEASMLLTTGADHQLAVWDLAVERDPEEEAALGTGNAAAEGLPPQLLFIHAGQKDPKEGHWHSQIPGLIVSTAADGFNIFKPSNL